MFIISNSNLLTSVIPNSKKSLNVPINVILTMFSNDLHRPLTAGEISFVKIARDKHLICNDYFYNYDYPHMKNNHFRQVVHRLGSNIIKCTDTRPAAYRLNHVHFDELLTIKGTGVPKFRPDLVLDKYLKLCKQQPPQWHDIKLHVETDLYDYLAKTDLPQGDYNKSYQIDVPIYSRFAIKAVVNKAKMMLHVGCTNNALSFTPDGIGQLQSLMGGVEVYLRVHAQSSEFFIQPTGEWLVTNYHFNRDLEIDVPDLSHTINYLREHATVYIHEQNKKKFLRYEKKITTSKTINQIQEEFK